MNEQLILTLRELNELIYMTRAITVKRTTFPCLYINMQIDCYEVDCSNCPMGGLRDDYANQIIYKVMP